MPEPGKGHLIFKSSLDAASELGTAKPLLL